MSKFWDLFEKNVVISGALALMFGGAVAYLAVTGQPIPDYLGAAVTGILGYFFGAGKARDVAVAIRGK